MRRRIIWPGQHVRWRYTSGPFRLLHDRPQEVVPERRLRSLLAVGPLRFRRDLTLQPHDDGCRLTASMLVRVPLPLLGALIERGCTPARRPERPSRHRCGHQSSTAGLTSTEPYLGIVADPGSLKREDTDCGCRCSG
jgi:hypothetical protein